MLPPLDQQIVAYRERQQRLKQARIDRWVGYLDRTITVLQLVIGTVIVVYAVGCIERLDTQELPHEIGAID